MRRIVCSHRHGQCGQRRRKDRQEVARKKRFSEQARAFDGSFLFPAANSIILSIVVTLTAFSLSIFSAEACGPMSGSGQLEERNEGRPVKPFHSDRLSVEGSLGKGKGAEEGVGEVC